MTLGALAALLSSCTWAVGVSAYARLARAYPAPTINATRALVAAPLFALYVLVESGGLAGAREVLGALAGAPLGWLGLSVITSYALGDVLFLRSANAIGVPAALSIASSYPLWAALGGVVFRGEALLLSRLGGVIVVVVGTVLVIAGAAQPAATSAAEPARRRSGVGIALGFATSGLWALNSLAVGMGSQDLSVGVASLFRMSLALALCPLIGSLGRTKGTPAFLPRPALKGLLWAFVLETFGGTLLFTYGLKHAPLSIGAALSSLAPVLAVPIALATGAERFSAAKSAGILLVVVGVFLLVS